MAETAEAHLPLIIFGDGQEAILFGYSVVKQKGKHFVKLRMMPTKFLREKYDIKDDELDSHSTITKMYPKEYYIVLDDDPKWGSRLLLCDYNTQKTDLIKGQIDSFVSEVQALRLIVYTQRAQIAYLFEQLKQVSAESEEIDKVIVERFKNIASTLKLTTPQSTGVDHDD